MSNRKSPILFSGKVGGEEGLVLAVIATAVNDAVVGDDEHRQDAFRYFASQAYEAHVAVLGLPLQLPAALREGV